MESYEKFKNGTKEEKQCTRKKWKSITNIMSMKDVIVDSNKLFISTLQMAEEGCMKRHEQQVNKDDLVEEIRCVL